MGQFVFWVTLNMIIQSMVASSNDHSIIGIVMMYIISLVFAGLHLKSK